MEKPVSVFKLTHMTTVHTTILLNLTESKLILSQQYLQHLHLNLHLHLTNGLHIIKNMTTAV